jgi:hypothetical protein
VDLPFRALTSEQKRLVLTRLLELWNQVPEWRLGQLMVNTTSYVNNKASFPPPPEPGGWQPPNTALFFQISDQKLIETIAEMLND